MDVRARDPVVFDRRVVGSGNRAVKEFAHMFGTGGPFKGTQIAYRPGSSSSTMAVVTSPM